MKSLVEFIIENKNKINHKFVLIRPMGRAYDMFYDDMHDSMIVSDNKDPDLWVIKYDLASDLVNSPKFKEFKREIAYFEIPEEDIDKFKKDYKTGKFKYNQLTKIDANNI